MHSGVQTLIDIAALREAKQFTVFIEVRVRYQYVY